MWDPTKDMQRIVEAVEKAPSVFNSRPWYLRPVSPDRIELRARLSGLGDELRDHKALPGSRHFVDPLTREGVISCGAALYNLRLAIRVAGHNLTEWLVPDLNADPELLASVEIVTGRISRPTRAEEELYEAIWLRHTNRWPYRILPVPLPLLVEMENVAAAEHGWLRVMHHRETKKWLRLAASARGVRPGARIDMVGSSGVGPRPENLTFPPTREDFWRPGPADPVRFESPRWLRTHGVQLMALSTDDDRPLDWLRAGQALQRALLTVTRYSASVPYGRVARYQAPYETGLPARRLPRGADLTKEAEEAEHRASWSEGMSRQPRVALYGVTASFLTQPFEQDDLMRRHRRWPWRSHYPEVPQMVLRVGYAPVESVPAPSRPREQAAETPAPASSAG